MLREGGRGSQNHGYKIMKRGAANERQFAGDTASPGELLFIRSPALPSVVSVFFNRGWQGRTADEEAVRGDTRGRVGSAVGVQPLGCSGAA